MSEVYGKFKRALARDQIGGDITALDIRCIIIDADDYTVSQLHEFLSDIPAGARIAVSAAVTGITVSEAGAVDCDDISWTGVSGDPSEAVIFYIHTGVEGTSRLITYIDGAGAALTPDGGNVNGTINNIVNL